MSGRYARADVDLALSEAGDCTIRGERLGLHHAQVLAAEVRHLRCFVVAFDGEVPLAGARETASDWAKTDAPPLSFPARVAVALERRIAELESITPDRFVTVARIRRLADLLGSPVSATFTPGREDGASWNVAGEGIDEDASSFSEAIGEAERLVLPKLTARRKALQAQVEALDFAIGRIGGAQ